ncbi:MAG: YciI-like protein [Parvibaculaceae bacterium]|jgi:uncharacterized protein YciI
MLFAIICTDKSGALDLRMQTRPEHVAYLKSLGSALKAAGPFLDNDGKPMGSLVIVSADDKSGAENIAANDPYAKAGLFQAVEIRGWNWTLNNPEAP